MTRLLTVAALVFASFSPAWAAPERVTLAVANMTCAACPITVKHVLTKVKGVTGVRVDLGRKEAVVDFDNALTAVPALIAATTGAGYPSSVAPSAGK